ncbi:MAG: sugar O-acetyltransferase [Bacteroidetes bacterium]|nr:sugar O-acetyltransferase [Bacteroidota bacterium]
MINIELSERMKSGQPFRLDDPAFQEIVEFKDRTLRLSIQLNASTDTDEVRDRLSDIIGSEIDKSTTIFAPFFTNFGRYISIGKNVFINHACSFLDMGGITVGDNVLIGPKVNLVSENHPIDPTQRKSLIGKPIVIKNNAWIGASATILPGITVGENSIVAAGSIVTKDVPDNCIVAGNPAKQIKTI